MSNAKAENMPRGEYPFSHYVHHRLHLNRQKKKIMGVSYALLLKIGEGISYVIIAGIIWANGIADIKSIIGILIAVGFFIMHIVEWRLKIADKKLDRKIKEYDFNKKVERDRQNIKP